MIDMPTLRLWKNRKTTLVIGNVEYRGIVVKGNYRQDRCFKSENTPERLEPGYAFRTEDGQEIRLYTESSPRVIAKDGRLIQVD